MIKYSTADSVEPAPVLRAALSYARRGWSVYPVRVDSRAAYLSEKVTGRRWGASSDLKVVEQMFRRFPSAGVAIETGFTSGFFVIEIDNKNGKNGSASLAELLDRHRGTLPWTAIAESPTGGRHWYYKHPGYRVRTSASNLGNGIDVLGENFNVIAPPSRGRRWITNAAAIAAPPAWLVDLVCEQREQRQPRRSCFANVEQAPLAPDTLAMWVRDAGLGLSSDPSDLLSAEDVDLKIWCALRVIPADIDYLDWFRIGCGIYAALGDAGFEYFDEWSREAPHKYPGKGCADKWRECAKITSIGPETIYFLADREDRRWRDAYRIMLAKGAA
ncbi:bifunctional DNA primase/polymerase [Bradyrhizobium sp. 138]|uniref:bifunctional DNA primase/polymerase n=1 Tax=Bradyrhizobium sp. 138 TaxID=2782615 RepID=UPI001FF96834|nr:bifunctional DNA primase/polymerase [Bradyrhizobium sp. 138]MCK1732950.1 bifunctional DNA primase/polymerase [Bradyrhizobium sp. 138]